MKYLLLFSVLLTACSSVQVPPPTNVVAGMGDSDYMEILNKSTRKHEHYQGFYNMYQAHVVLQTTEVVNAMLQRRGHFQQWTEERFSSEKEKAAQEMSSQTRFSMSFYSPESQYDDLSKGNTIWKVYLDLDGKRYEGAVKKKADKLAEIQLLFPFHERFNTLYEVSFPVATSLAEVGQPVMTLTSSLGTSTFQFSP